MTTTVTSVDGTLRVQDGPFADTKEQLGGTFVIEVDDLDSAIAWAGRAPSVGWGAVEIRPTATRFVDGAWMAFDSSMTDAADVRAAAERAARTSYGRLLAVLAASTRDVALAEDALADAFEKALRTWPDSGIPDNPKGGSSPWHATGSATSSRSAALRTSGPARRGRAARPRPDGCRDAVVERGTRSPTSASSCCSPARTPRSTRPSERPLMLQTVLGFDAAQIARAYRASSPPRWRSGSSARSVASATPASRSRCRPAPTCRRGFPPCSRRSTARTRSTGSTRAMRVRESLADEARWLAVLLASLLETEPEAWGLAALLTLRAVPRSRRTATPWPPLDDQDPAVWDADLIVEGRALLRRRPRSAPRSAGSSSRPRSRPCTAIARAPASSTPTTLVTLYRGLVAIAPTAGRPRALAAAEARLAQPTRPLLGAARVTN